MNENINLTEILKDCPIGWEFYSSIYGNVTFCRIENDTACPIVFFFIDKDGIGNSFNNTKERDEYCKQQENMLKDLGVGVIWYHDYKTLPQELLMLI